MSERHIKIEHFHIKDESGDYVLLSADVVVNTKYGLNIHISEAEAVHHFLADTPEIKGLPQFKKYYRAESGSDLAEVFPDVHNFMALANAELGYKGIQQALNVSGFNGTGSVVEKYLTNLTRGNGADLKSALEAIRFFEYLEREGFEELQERNPKFVLDLEFERMITLELIESLYAPAYYAENKKEINERCKYIAAYNEAEVFSEKHTGLPSFNLMPEALVELSVKDANGIEADFVAKLTGFTAFCRSVVHCNQLSIIQFLTFVTEKDISSFFLNDNLPNVSFR